MTVKIEGLEELLKALEGTSLTMSFKKASVGFSKEVKDNLAFLVNERYAISKSELSKSFLGKSENVNGSSLTIQLDYQHNPTTLGARYNSRFWGNINPGAKREGQVHLVQVRRGNKLISYGREQRGGFMSPNKAVKGQNMYERIGKSRKSLRLLFTMSAAQATEQVFLKNKDFDNYLNLLSDKLVSKTSETLFT
jgi:hypothetical protein